MKYGTIRNENLDVLYQSNLEEFNDVAKEIYRAMDLNYPKFYKMDDMSKAALLCCEELLKDKRIDLIERKGIFLVNKSSSLAIDEEYQSKTFANDEISQQPAMFVYTLPNAMIGVLSIRHKFKGEQSMWIRDSFDANSICNYVNLLFLNDIINMCLIGWVDFYKNKECVFLSMVEKVNSANKKLELFNAKNLDDIYNKLISL